MVASALTTAIEIAATVASCYLYLSLVPELRRVHSERSIVSLPFLPIISMFGMCACIVIYGYLIENYFPLMGTNAVGMLISTGYIVLYAKHAADARAFILRCFGFTVLALLMLVSYCLWSPSSGSSLETQVGCVCVTCAALLFGSPLVVVKQVIKHKNSVFLPATMVIAGMLNSLLWAVYGVILGNLFVSVPNFVNLVLGLMQLALILLFPKRPLTIADDLETGSTAVVAVASSDPVNDNYASLKSPSLTKR